MPIIYTVFRLSGNGILTTCARKATKFCLISFSLARYLYKCLQ